MNTERPDNDDAPEVGAAENTGTTRDAEGTVGAAGAGEAAEAEAAEQQAAEEQAAEQQAAADSPHDEHEEHEDHAGREGHEVHEGHEVREEHEEQASASSGASGEKPAVASAQEVPRAEDEAPHDEQLAPHEEQDEHDVSPGQSDQSDQSDEVRQGSRRRSPAVIASVAAAVLLVGGGGAYLAASAAGGGGGNTASGASGDGTPPPLHLDGYSAPSEGGGNAIAPGEPNPYGATYRAAGSLPDGPGSAPVYWAKGEVGKDEVARLAKALGVEGTPVAQGQSWTVGAKDAAGPSLQVTRQAPGSWTFHRYAPGTDNCQSTLVCTKDPANPAVDPVSEAAAKKAAAPVLKAVGQDDAKIDASQLMGAQRVVNAEPEAGGLPTYGWTTGITVGPRGEVVGGSGQLKAPVKGDSYPVLSAEKTLSLMNAAPGTDHRMGIGGCASPVPLKDRLEAPCGQSTSSAPPKDTFTVEKAVFGLAAHYADGRRALVPSWLFEVRAQGAQDAFTVTYPAVDPKYLASPTPSGEPTGQPSPRPTGPKDQPTSAPVTRNVQVDGYTADGKELTVAFTGGVCADYKVTASESEDEVTVRVTETSHPEKVCILIAKIFHKTVQLDEPLGDRKVVGSDGKAIPLEKATGDHRLPETSGAR